MAKTKKSKQINKQNENDLIRKSIELKGESRYVSDMTLNKNTNKEN